MCENYFMPDFVTSACRFMWSIHRPMKIGTGSELPDTVKMWHMGKPSARRFEKWLYRCGRMALPACKPLQILENGFRKRQNPFVGNEPLGRQNHEFGLFCGFCGFVSWMTRHRSVSEREHWQLSTVANLWKKGKGKWAIWMVGRLEICRASQVHWLCMICCAFNHIRKDGTTHLSRIVYHL